MPLSGLWTGGLTVRRVCALIRFLPVEASVWAELGFGAPGWTVESYLLADLFMAFAGERHPDHPAEKATAKARAEKVRERLERQRARHGKK